MFVVDGVGESGVVYVEKVGGRVNDSAGEFESRMKGLDKEKGRVKIFAENKVASIKSLSGINELRECLGFNMQTFSHSWGSFSFPWQLLRMLVKIPCDQAAVEKEDKFNQTKKFGGVRLKVWPKVKEVYFAQEDIRCEGSPCRE